jgi:hypothetical protein
MVYDVVCDWCHLQGFQELGKRKNGHRGEVIVSVFENCKGANPRGNLGSVCCTWIRGVRRTILPYNKSSGPRDITIPKKKVDISEF